MDLKQLQAMGAINSRALVKKDIAIKRPVPIPQADWSDPEVAEYPDDPKIVEETVQVHIRKRSSADFIEMMNADDRDKPFVAILRCVCHPDGSQVFESLDQLMGLKEWIWIPLMMAVNEVNEFGLKNSQPRTSSGAKSRSPSAARSRKRKNASVKKSARSGSPTATNLAPSIQ